MNNLKAPIKIIDNFVPDYFYELWENLPLKRIDGVPRLECWMNDYNSEYTYGSGRGIRTYKSVPYNNIVLDIRNKLRETEHANVDACFINAYENERDHLGWHSDDSPEINDDIPIAIVSFGAEREIWFRPKGAKGPHTDSVLMKSGSLVLMSAGMQDTWEHRI